MTRRIIGLLITLILGLLVAPLAVEAQQAGKVYRIGWLSQGMRPDELPFLEALRVLGYVEGHNLFVERRYAEMREHLPALASELVTRKVDLMVTLGTPATRAAQQATSTIPIVFGLSADPVQSGLVASYVRPGGNLTGIAVGLYEDKLLEISKEATPGIMRVACTLRRNPQDRSWVKIEAAARELGLELLNMPMQGPDDFDHFFAAALRAGADAVLVHDSAWFSPHLTRLGELAAQHRLPAISVARRFAEAGGLLSYQRAGSTSRMAAQVDKILQGSQPADLPVEQPMQFELVINLKTAKALGLTIPPMLLFQATEVIR